MRGVTTEIGAASWSPADLGLSRRVDDIDVHHLRRCLELATAARAVGNEPFGSAAASAGDGTVLLELMNTVGVGA